jgi:hypothetical protein
VWRAADRARFCSTRAGSTSRCWETCRMTALMPSSIRSFFASPRRRTLVLCAETGPFSIRRTAASVFLATSIAHDTAPRGADGPNIRPLET